MDDSPNIAHARKLYEAFGRGDFASVLSAFASPIDFRANYPAGTALEAWAGSRSSKESVMAYFSAMFALQDIETWEPRRFFASGDDVVVVGHQRARVKATGRSYEQEWVHMITFKAGLVARFRHWGDVGSVLPAFQP